MPGNRAIVQDAGGLVRVARAGDGPLMFLTPNIQALDSNQVLTAAQMLSGLYVRNGMTVGRSDTTDTAVNILAGLPGLDIGDTYCFVISVNVAFVLTLLAGVGVTLGLKSTVSASGFSIVMITKNSTTTVTIAVL